MHRIWHGNDAGPQSSFPSPGGAEPAGQGGQVPAPFATCSHPPTKKRGLGDSIGPPTLRSFSMNCLKLPFGGCGIRCRTFCIWSASLPIPYLVLGRQGKTDRSSGGCTQPASSPEVRRCACRMYSPVGLDGDGRHPGWLLEADGQALGLLRAARRVPLAREIVAVVQQQRPAEDVDHAPDGKVLPVDVVGPQGPHLVDRGLGLRQLVLGQLHAAKQLGEGVAARVALLDLCDLDRVVGQEVLEGQGQQVAVQLVRVVPNGKEAKDLAVERKELLRRGADPARGALSASGTALPSPPPNAAGKSHPCLEWLMRLGRSILLAS